MTGTRRPAVSGKTVEHVIGKRLLERLRWAAKEDGFTLAWILRAAVIDYLQTRRVEIESGCTRYLGPLRHDK